MTVPNCPGVALFQSTHPRGVRRILEIGLMLFLVTFQSTHPRGVRRCLFQVFFHTSTYFNPRTHEGCDFFDTSVSFPPIAYFNPRTHEGCDNFSLVFLSGNRVFQSTHPRGVRHLIMRNLSKIQLFQSTHPRGVRQVTHLTSASGFSYFNPRTHEGCDKEFKIPKIINNDFNPRTHEGCDRFLLQVHRQL